MMYTFLLFYIQSGQYAPIVLLLHFFYAEREREREREKEGMGWIDYSYYFNFSDMYY
jgi:hypothetical protein